MEGAVGMMRWIIAFGAAALLSGCGAEGAPERPKEPQFFGDKTKVAEETAVDVVEG